MAGLHRHVKKQFNLRSTGLREKIKTDRMKPGVNVEQMRIEGEEAAALEKAIQHTDVKKAGAYGKAILQAEIADIEGKLEGLESFAKTRSEETLKALKTHLIESEMGLVEEELRTMDYEDKVTGEPKLVRKLIELDISLIESKLWSLKDSDETRALEQIDKLKKRLQ